MDSHCRDNSKGGHTHLAPKIIGSSHLKCENIEGQRRSAKKISWLCNFFPFTWHAFSQYTILDAPKTSPKHRDDDEDDKDDVDDDDDDDDSYNRRDDDDDDDDDVY